MREPLSRFSLRGLKLKRDVVGSFSLGRVAICAVAEQTELPRYDFSPVAGAASVFSLVLASPEPSFDVNLTAFGKQAFAVVSERRDKKSKIAVCKPPYSVNQSEDPANFLPVHSILLVKHGVHILENIKTEELAADKAMSFSLSSPRHGSKDPYKALCTP